MEIYEEILSLKEKFIEMVDAWYKEQNENFLKIVNK
jgi:hypothetical protein